MTEKIGIVIQEFDEIRDGKCFYIDKTYFIREWWESKDKATLIARPRRFGKTLNMSMLKQFFSVDYKDREDLFEELSIWEEKEYRQLQGTYPVISLSFANIKEKNFPMTRKKICQLITKLYEEYSFLLFTGLLGEADKRYFRRVSENMDDSDASLSLYQLSDYLYRYYGKKVIILLDEYDTPMQEAYVNGFWDELASFTRSLFNSTFKTNPYLERAIMTGITRVSKESVFSDLNNLEVVTTTSNKYMTAFGFTEEEVFNSLEKFGYGDKKEEIKKWYDGFVFGKITDIYNPWSILNFLDKGKIDTYWANTSSNGLVSKLVREGDADLKSVFEELLKGKNILCPIDEQIVYNQLDDDSEAVWSLLLASGYLKVVSIEKKVVGKRQLYELSQTNMEVLDMFYDMVRGWFKKSAGNYNAFVKALLINDVEAMNEYMNVISEEIFSNFDVGTKPSKLQPERLVSCYDCNGVANGSSLNDSSNLYAMTSKSSRFYHGFVLGLLVDLAEDYIVTSNRESGFGRYDVMIEPKDRSKEAFILEFKVYNPRKEDSLEETVENALIQIEEKQYETNLSAKGIPIDNIKKYGFAFKGKKVLIGCRG